MQPKGFLRADTERLPDAGTDVNVAFHTYKTNPGTSVLTVPSWDGIIYRGPIGSGSVFTIGEERFEHGALYTIGSTKMRVKGSELDRQKQKDDAIHVAGEQ